jgi:SulP family sulfate permease
MAHALLASVNPVLGLYTLMVATPVGALFTSSVFMNVSTTSALAVAAGDTLTTYPSSDRGTVLVTLVLLIGVFQVVLGLLRLGWITRFIPLSVMTGSMTGVAGGSSSGTALMISAGARSRWANIFAGVFVAVVSVAICQPG